MKCCLDHYSHKSKPDAKFDCGIFSSFGLMTSQNFPLKKGTSHKIRIFTPRKEINIKNNIFMSRFVLFDPKLTPMSISTIFKQRKFFRLRRLNERKAAATPLIDQFCQNFVRRCLNPIQAGVFWNHIYCAPSVSPLFVVQLLPSLVW